ncbi:predicted protein [Lichtheimia corymbifera JMRC:FSU:9682]|uniref:Uncharacterized protein n=1 Tax=Lichtheimia corymbifera JMRC:FSU:9682 TaxID=1263082 RepID=A0A068RFF2_9FUNG|nr:predicted protein [Lichtheimia corymbifera JMRC:FSU:9682]
MEENDQERIDQQPDAYQQRSHIGSDGCSSDVFRCNDEISWNVPLITWSVVCKNDHVDTAEDDHILDGMLTAMDDPGILKTMQSWMKEDYNGSNQE